MVSLTFTYSWSSICDGIRSLGVTLVELIIEEEVFLPRPVVYSTLVCVLNSRVGGPGDDVRDISHFVGDIVDRQGVLIIA